MKKENAFQYQINMTNAPSIESIDMITDEVTGEAASSINNTNWSAEVAENLGTANEGRHVAPPATLEAIMNLYDDTQNTTVTGAIKKAKNREKRTKTTQAATNGEKNKDKTRQMEQKVDQPTYYKNIQRRCKNFEK